jgi:hypothetical protein
MRRLGVIALAILLAAVLYQPAALADSSLQGFEFNINGALQTLDLTGFNTGAYNQTTGIGTLTYIFNPGAPGSYNFTSVFFVPAGVPAYNEFGSTSGSPASGQSWEIGDINFSNIVADEQAAALTNTNSLPGTKDNFLKTCVGATCNGSVAMAMGFNFNLASGDEALITLNFSTTNPGGFFLSDTHPADVANNSASTVYFTGSEVSQPVGVVPAPEPSTLVLLTAALGAFVFLKLRN